MTEKIEKDLESKSICPKHHGSTAEPDKSIQQVQAAWKDHPLSVCVALRLHGCLLTSGCILRQLGAGRWVSHVSEEETTFMRTVAFSRTMKFNLTV